MRLLWAARKKLNALLQLAEVMGKCLFNGLRRSAERMATLVPWVLLKVAGKLKRVLPWKTQPLGLLSATLETLKNKSFSTVPRELQVTARLDDDYGMEQSCWLKYQDALIRSIRPRKSNAYQRKGKLWICMSGKTPATPIEWHKVYSKLESLEGNTSRALGILLWDNGAPNREGTPPSPKVNNVQDLETLCSLMSPEDSILFTGVNDALEPAALRILEEQGAFAADLALFDFYYSDESRAYPIFLHGVDSLHCAHCDYFFSRFLVSSRLIKQEVSKSAGMSLRRAAVCCFSAADPCSTIHIPTPLLCASLSRNEVSEAKKATEKHPIAAVNVNHQVSAIICTKNNHLLLKQLVWRLKHEKAIKDIIIVSNNSTSPGMHSLLSQLDRSGEATIVTYNKQFNFSEQSNLGATIASGDSFLFINDDITPVNENWLHYLIESGAWNRKSIVGPLLIYPDQRVQHAGMFLGFNNTAGHLMRFSRIPDETSGFGLHAPRKVACVTGAAMLVPREAFENLNGFDVSLAYYLQDVDLCMRATGMGLDVVFDPRSVLIHFESVSVKPVLAEPHVSFTREREFAYFRRRWPLPKDNWFNPNISPQDEAMKSLLWPAT